MSERLRLPAKYDALLAQIEKLSPTDRRLWEYALAILLIDDNLAEFVDSHLDGDTLHLRVRTVDQGEFSVIRPIMSEEIEQFLLEQMREMVREEGA